MKGFWDSRIAGIPPLWKRQSRTSWFGICRSGFIDGRSTIVEEIHTERPLLREYLGTEITGLLAAPGFMDALPGYLLPDAASQSRIGTVLGRLLALASP